MGKRSVKENKNIWQQAREAADLTREEASEAMEFVSADRIEKIENERSPIHPEETLAMAKSYRNATLPNYYCSHECPIGQRYVPELAIKDLTQLTLEALNTLNSLEKDKERFIEISADSKLSPEELPDFLTIQKKLSEISRTADALRLWLEQQIAEGIIDPGDVESASEP